ncbi:unnamed protein product, partial [Symbiodinium microadriaticum]
STDPYFDEAACGLSMASDSSEPCYSVGSRVEVDWPLLTGGFAPFHATVVAIASRKRKADADSHSTTGDFKYLLRWQDGASDCWQTLRKLSHRPVAQKGDTMPWKDKCEAADHAETPLAAYRDVARILHYVAEHLGK